MFHILMDILQYDLFNGNRWEEYEDTEGTEGTEGTQGTIPGEPTKEQ